MKYFSLAPEINSLFQGAEQADSRWSPFGLRDVRWWARGGTGVWSVQE